MGLMGLGNFGCCLILSYTYHELQRITKHLIQALTGKVYICCQMINESGGGGWILSEISIKLRWLWFTDRLPNDLIGMVTFLLYIIRLARYSCLETNIAIRSSPNRLDRHLGYTNNLVITELSLGQSKVRLPHWRNRSTSMFCLNSHWNVSVFMKYK